VGITRAQRSLMVSWNKRRKKGRDMVNALPSRFIAEMGLQNATTQEDPREKLRALRAELALKVEAEKALEEKAEHKA
jgi:ATP-dependent DNA helicase Rep